MSATDRAPSPSPKTSSSPPRRPRLPRANHFCRASTARGTTHMSFLHRVIKNRKIVYLLTTIAVIIGVHSLLNMPRREDPKITIRLGLVLAGYPGATAEQVEEQVARKIEPLLFHYAEVKKRKT